MPLYVADYLADTSHLSTLEHGAYLLLLMHYWRQGKLPSDDRQLAHVARMSLKQWLAIRPTIADFFNEGWVHSRVAREMDKANQKSEARASAGSEGGKAKALKYKGAPAAKASNMPEQTVIKTLPSSSLPDVTEDKSDDLPSPLGAAEQKATKQKRATRLPADWRPSEKNRSDALRLGVPGSSVDRLAERFRDYWTAKAGKDGAKLDWDATFRNWCSNECERRGWAPMLADGDGPLTGDTTASGRFYAMQDTPEFDAWAQHTRKRMADAKGGWWFESRWPPGWKRETPEREAPASGVFAFEDSS
jgi:uncharacterized protein YdaU (DUF1376 family)